MVAYSRLQLPLTPAAGAAVWRALTRVAPGLALIVAALGLAACQHVPGVRARAAPPSAVTAPAVPAGAMRYRIDGERSEVLILVYRDGRLANLGHNHVVAVRQLSGEIVAADDPVQSHWHLQFPVDALSVDDPQLRGAQGAEFQTQLDQEAIAGTRDHLLGAQLLDAAHYPSIQLQSEQIRNDADGLHLGARITVRDHTVVVELPLALQRSADQLIASGEFDLTHSQLGLTPYSVALGALRVADRMHVRYRLVAQRASD